MAHLNDLPPTYLSQSALILSFLVLCLSTVETRSADASPWVLPKEKFVFSMTTGYSQANREFINTDQGKLQRFPLKGKLQIYSLRLSGRYGLQDRLELEVSTSLQMLNYSAESFLKGEGAELTNLDTSEAGLGDVYLTLTRQLSRSSWPISFQLSLKLPTGYRLPAPNLLALGSGQADLSGVLQMGHLFKSGTLLGLEGGAVLRLNGPGEQLKYGVKVAQRVWGRLFLFVAQTGYHSITEGESSGLFNQVSRNPEVSAQEFNIEETYLLPFTLTQDLHQAEIGFFLGTQSKVEYSGAFILPWSGRNATQLFSFFLNISHPLF